MSAPSRGFFIVSSISDSLPISLFLHSCFLGLLQPVAMSEGLKATDIYSLDSGGQKSKVRPLAEVVLSGTAGLLGTLRL